MHLSLGIDEAGRGRRGARGQGHESRGRQGDAERLPRQAGPRADGDVGAVPLAVGDASGRQAGARDLHLDESRDTHTHERLRPDAAVGAITQPHRDASAGDVAARIEPLLHPQKGLGAVP